MPWWGETYFLFTEEAFALKEALSLCGFLINFFLVHRVKFEIQGVWNAAGGWGLLLWEQSQFSAQLSLSFYLLLSTPECFFCCTEDLAWKSPEVRKLRKFAQGVHKLWMEPRIKCFKWQGLYSIGPLVVGGNMCVDIYKQFIMGMFNTIIFSCLAQMAAGDCSRLRCLHRFVRSWDYHCALITKRVHFSFFAEEGL